MIRAALLMAYIAVLLAVDRSTSREEQWLLGLLTVAVLVGACWRLDSFRRSMVIGVVFFATMGEIVGSIIWGVYRYRLGNLPPFVPPAHGLVFLAGFWISEAMSRHKRRLVLAAASAAATWGVLGLTVLPRLDVAGAIGVPILLVFLWRSPSRAIYAGIFLVVTALELYGTAIGTWRWAVEIPGTGIPDGNPPSGVAAGYVWFDVMALLVAPHLIARARSFRRADPVRRASIRSS